MFDWLGTLLTESPRTDLLRLAAVPVFGWAAYRDVLTRRVPNRTWLPLAALGVVLLAWDAWRVATGDVLGGVTTREWFFLRVAISLGMVAPLGYLFYWFGGFGGADAKALIVLAVLFPTYPELLLPASSLPLVRPTIGVFSLTILTNTVVVGAVYPLGVACKNAATGHVGKAMLIGKPVRAEAVTTEYGSLLQTPDGFTRRGLDLDALRMYLRWRGATLAAVRADPATHRDPASLPDEPKPPGDGSIRRDGDRDAPDDAVATDGGSPGSSVDSDAGNDAESARGDPETTTGESDGESDSEADADPWGAAAFLDDVEGDAYGTTPEKLRDGLEVLVAEDTVWISPGLPFIVPMFLGLVVSVVYGDVLVAAISLLS